MSTTMLKKESVVRRWYVLDAAGKPLGKTAEIAANLLRGKLRPDYTPHVDCGDFVIVVNAEKVKVTGKKLDQKVYYRHSDFVGGLKEATLREMMEKKPDRVIEHAVKGMLPKGPVGSEMFSKLHVYVGPDHPHQAQKPETLEV